MRKVHCIGQGGIEALTITDVPAPEATSGYVVVRITASCINPGTLAAPAGAPFKPARDLAGEVVMVGDGVDGFAIGDAVLGWSDDSAHAELAAVPAAQLVKKPESLPWDVAGSLYVSSLAARASVDAIAPGPGEVVVIAGATGGVGIVAAQLAKRAGAKVIGLARDENVGWLEARGIVPVVHGEGQKERLRAVAPRVDAFLDYVGAGYVTLALALGVPKERINTIVDFAAAKEHGVKTTGTRDAGGVLALQEIAALAARGELVVPIAGTFPLGAVQDAYRAVARKAGPGKVVLHPQE